MKKIMSICLAVLLTASVSAAERLTPEERATRDYSTWLPAQGDFSVGFSIDPIATFIGNAFNGTTANGLDDLAGEGLRNNMVSLMGSYMVGDNLELTMNVGFTFANKTNRTYVIDDKAIMLDPFTRDKVIDVHKINNNGGSFALGLNYRAGKTRRVQGIFGGGVLYGFDVQREKYSYGNVITEANQVPTIATTYTAYTPLTSFIPNARKLNDFSYSPSHYVGLYGTFGVEFFVAPKIALGANVNLQLIYEFESNQYITYEGWNVNTKQLEEYTNLTSPGDRGFVFGVDNIGANIYMSFYF